MPRPALTDPDQIVALADERMLVRYRDGEPIHDRASDAIVPDDVMQQMVDAGRIAVEPRTGPATFYVTPGAEQ